MTFEDKAEVRRASVGTKVLAFGFAILAVLGSFWTIVWFIRSYVEPPRMTLAPSLALAARESAPVVPPAPTVRPAPMAADPQPTGTTPAPAVAETAPATAPALAGPADTPSVTGSIADRWLPMTPAAPESALAPAPAAAETAASPAPAESAEQPADEVAESTVPAISGPAPLPRRKPMQTAAVRARTDPPLPRPRPDGPAPQSVWTAVPTTDDRYQAGQ
jgi:cytoskeletal protein RodZ